MRIENPTFALTQSGEVADSSPDVTQTVAPPPPPPPPLTTTTADKAGLVDGAGPSDVLYVRGWRLHKSRLWQALAALGLMLFVVMVVAYMSRGRHPPSVAPPPPPTARPHVSQLRECEQADCVYQAADMIRVMNLSTDPCHDFYNYACGNFKEVLPDRRNSREVFRTTDWLRDKNDKRVVQLLEDAPQAFNPDSTQWKLKTLYSSCLNDYENMKKAGKRMVKLINVLGGLDLLGTWDETLWQFNSTFRKVHDEHWTDAMMNFYWVRNPRRPTENMLRITKSGTGIPYTSAYLNPTIPPYNRMITAYQTTMATVMAMLVRDSGVNVTALNRTCDHHCLQNFVDDVMNVETKLANISTRYPGAILYRGRRRSRRQSVGLRLLRLRPPVFRLTLSELERRTPQVDWMGLFEDLMGEGIVSPSTVVEIPRYHFMDNLGSLIDGESKRALHHYLVWCVVRRHLMGMSVDYAFQKLRLDEVIRRSRKLQSREEYCLDVLDKHMGEAMGMLFVKDHIGLDTVRQTSNFTQTMVDAFKLSFQPWMTESVRYKASTILSNTTFHFGFPKWILSEQELDSYYEPLGVVPNDFFQNMKNIDLFKRIVLRNRLRYGNNKQRWTIKATHAQILSSTSGNYLAVPAGMMRSPIFSPQIPHYVNSGALGTLVGTHLSLFTVTNNESQILDRVWWDSATYERYHPYRGCVLDLYRNHTLRPSVAYTNVPQMQLRPERNAAALVSQHYALGVAYAEHRRVKALSDRPVRLPGLRHETSDQTFFLAFAQARCSTKRSGSTNYLLHRLAGIIPEDLQVNSAVYNHAKFRQVYRCSAVPAVYDHAPCTIQPRR
ncbi:endothelin-converting enzyme 1-like [Pollicipes pollicipes]|uniref:endothelin-converting enzyme 1-like n=1 Tax=Pollicipes pollicipes TaxID=41117 RepID=UPI0018857242|nr:endothelin-converting enzyme 1-like [Pollicipes pollicipes]